MEWNGTSPYKSQSIPGPFLIISGRTGNGPGTSQEWTRTCTRDLYDISIIQDCLGFPVQSQDSSGFHKERWGSVKTSIILAQGNRNKDLKLFLRVPLSRGVKFNFLYCFLQCQERPFNDIKQLPHHCCQDKAGSFFNFLSWQKFLLLLSHSCMNKQPINILHA